MLDQAQGKAEKLEIFPLSKISITKKNKFRRRRSTTSPSPSPSPSSTAVTQLVQQSKRSSSNGLVKRRVKTLKGLIPNSHECIGVDGLFRETADYILALQLKVQVMQTMIDLLSNASSD